MIRINREKNIYVCPYCGCRQSYSNTYHSNVCGYSYDSFHPEEKDLAVFHIECTNQECSKITVVAFDRVTGKQFDIYPENVHREFPNYVPKQILDDYVEASSIIRYSPKASATLLRRCLQGMIRDYWNIKKNSLKEEIDELQSKIPDSQWKAIDALRKFGNIGAHMEKDVSLIVDIDVDEANQLIKLVELLIEKWYVSRHDEEELLASIPKAVAKK